MINPNVVLIEEILGRASQGRTEPFLCRGEDDNLYYVKGKHTGRRSQVAEWIGSSLAAAFGLPAAQCVIVEIAPDLLSISPPEWRELGDGLAFGSLVANNVMEISVTNVGEVPSQLQRDLLIFDWWVKNGDRTLTEHGGNPNLLWSAVDRKVVVIDHNLAFDTDFDSNEFLTGHIFRDQWGNVIDDWIVRLEYQDRLVECLSCLEEIWDKMPDEWCWLGEGVPLNFDKNAAFNILNKCSSSQLWEVAR